MRRDSHWRRVYYAPVIALILGVGGGCNNTANEAEEITGEAAADAPATPEEFAKQQQEQAEATEQP